MTTLDDFKKLRASVPAEVQADLFKLFTSDPEASFQRMVELAAEKGQVGEVGSEAVDVVLREGYATELTTYAMSVGDKGFGEAIANGLLATCPDLYP